MRSHILFILLVFTVSGQLLAQNKDQEYFAKVPSRYVKPGLSPMQSIRLSYQQAPGNQWVKDAGELKLDLYRIKLNPRASVIISAGTWAGAKRQKHNLYEVNGSKAYEQTDYVYAAPTVSAGVSYGFFFPYFIAARFGVTKPWEAAYYKANLPILNTDGSGIKATDSEINSSKQGFGAVQKYMAIELYRPFKSHFKDAHPMGLSVSYMFMPDVVSGSKSAFNVGIYWHIKAK